jgi:hypothetical protein
VPLMKIGCCLWSQYVPIWIRWDLSPFSCPDGDFVDSWLQFSGWNINGLPYYFHKIFIKILQIVACRLVAPKRLRIELQNYCCWVTALQTTDVGRQRHSSDQVVAHAGMNTN